MRSGRKLMVVIALLSIPLSGLRHYEDMWVETYCWYFIPFRENAVIFEYVLNIDELCISWVMREWDETWYSRIYTCKLGAAQR